MKEGGGNIYEKKQIADEEQRRLQTLEYPTEISQKVIGDDLEGKTVLDLGAGPNTSLNLFIKERGGTYVAFDTNETFLVSQQKGGATAVRGSIEMLPFKERSVDIVHTRFVLMHLSPEQQTKAIEEAVQVARTKAIFLEYDWGAVTGGKLIEAFRKFAVAFMENRGMDPFMGQKLAGAVRAELRNDQLISISEKRFKREAGNYYREIIPLAKSMREVIVSMKQESLLAEVNELISQLEEEAQKETSEVFTRPDIVAVEAVKL